MSLQPIVENCIYHGIKKKRGSGHIIIRAFHSEPNLILQVKDDGCGMSRETCEKMLSYEIEQENISGSGIGVKNVNERIQLRFGKEYGLHYDSEEGKGTETLTNLWREANLAQSYLSMLPIESQELENTEKFCLCP